MCFPVGAKAVAFSFCCGVLCHVSAYAAPQGAIGGGLRVWIAGSAAHRGIAHAGCIKRQRALTRDKARRLRWSVLMQPAQYWRARVG
jgi:hypothetical protein